MTNTMIPDQTTLTGEDTSSDLIDPLAERLRRLDERRSAGAPEGPAASVRRPSRRRRPATRSKVAALAMSVAATGALSYYFANAYQSQTQVAAFSALPAPIAAQPPTTPAAHKTASTSNGATSGTSVSLQAFDGARIDTKYGPVQVQAQISGGSLQDIAMIVYPNGDGESIDINRSALPRLRTAALEAQSARVDTVSGATYTSEAYRQSLQFALDQARAAGQLAVTTQ